MSLELTENKSNIGSGALNDLVFILYCRVIGQWLPTCRQSVGDELGSDRQPIGEQSATGWRLYLERLFLIAESLQLFGDRSATDRRLVGDQSATKNCVVIVCNWSAISRQPLGDPSATCRRPPKTFLRSIWSQRGFTCSNQNLLATKSSLQPSATGQQLPCNLPATTRNFGHKEVADRLQAMCDRGFSDRWRVLQLTNVTKILCWSPVGIKQIRMRLYFNS